MESIVLWAVLAVSATRTPAGGITLAPTNIACDSTPCALTYGITGLAPDTTYWFKVRIKAGTRYFGQTFDTLARVWRRQSARWSDQSVLRTDGQGKTSGRAFFRAAAEPVAAGTLQIVLRKTATEVNLDDLPLAPGVTVLDRAACGWLTGHAFRDQGLAAPCTDHLILALAGGNQVGGYCTEDNRVADGMDDPGRFRFAVPVGRIDSLVVVNAAGVRYRPGLRSGPGWTVAAGETLDVDRWLPVEEPTHDSGVRATPGTSALVPGLPRTGVPELYDALGRRVARVGSAGTGVYFIREAGQRGRKMAVIVN